MSKNHPRELSKEEGLIPLTLTLSLKGRGDIIYQLFFTFILILISACASTQKEKPEDIISAIQQATEEEAEVPSPASLPEMESEALEAVSTLKEEKPAGVDIKFEDGKLSCELKNADLREVISKIAELTEMEFVSSTNIYGRINANFADKELQDGLELILDTAGYSLEEKDGVYVISRSETTEETGVKFHEVQPKYVSAEELISQIASYYGLNPALQYSALTKEGELEDNSQEEQLAQEPSSFLVYGDATEFDIYSTIIEEEIGMRYFRGPVSLKVKDLRLMKAIGRNSIYISGPTAQVDKLLELIAVLDQKMPQVMIETWLVEYDDNALKEAGIDLSEGLLGKVSDFAFGTVSTEIFDLPAILRGMYVNKQKIPPAEEGLLEEEKTITQYTIALQALMDKNKLTISSKPYIVVRSGMLARISAASEQFVIASSPGGIVSGELEQVETKTSFNIIPTVISDNLIQIKMNLEQSAFTAPAPGAVLGTNKNTANTALTVANGETIVIGGINSSRQSISERGVPLLSKIPLIKYLFSAATKSTESRKVNFYVTPHILPVKKGIIKAEEE
jgi:type IV pilus assembly protein PilQ